MVLLSKQLICMTDKAVFWQKANKMQWHSLHIPLIMDTLSMNVLCSQPSHIYHLCPKEDRWNCAFTDR